MNWLPWAASSGPNKEKEPHAGFSYDNQMVAIYFAIGLFQQRKPLSATNPGPEWTWRVSRMDTFCWGRFRMDFYG